jgi:cyclophilin family peptidyl-prolyl cis-trans isomerase/HEAT repeat protein
MNFDLYQRLCTCRNWFALFGLISLLWSGCVPYQEEVITEVKSNLQDPVLRKIIAFQDAGKVDSLYSFFRHIDPTYRYAAAWALGSVRDSATVDSLAILLKDRIGKVRQAAAFAIGQTGGSRGESYLLDAFERTDTAGVFTASNAAILEAVGKCGQATSLISLAGITTYTPKDTLLLEGQAWGIYRFALRSIVAPEGTARMLELVMSSEYPGSVRLIAANYLSRAKDINLAKDSAELVGAFSKEKNHDIRMALAIACGKTKSLPARGALMHAAHRDEDYRVQCNSLRALRNFDYLSVRDTIFAALRQTNPHVAHAAAQYFWDNGIADDAPRYWQEAMQPSRDWQTQFALYAAALKYLPSYKENTLGQVNYELRRRYELSQNAYEKALALEALGEFGWNFRYLIDQISVSDLPVVRTAGMRGLSRLCSRPDFERIFGLGSRQVRREILGALREAVYNGDQGVMAEAAGILRIPLMDFKTLLADSTAFLGPALQKLKLPRDIEIYRELQQTIDFLKGAKTTEPWKPDYNHRISWTLIDRLTPASKVTLTTSRGDIQLEVLPMEAPGSVANFLDLVQSGFLNSKYFHRVVSNFVIQGGCPRGDGYGALDYTIRSELSPRHFDQEGYVGMASAGNHTEGTQFFITHSPAPHLDGNYTIFARVTGGMNVVHSIQVGDKIEKAQISF